MDVVCTSRLGVKAKPQEVSRCERIRPLGFRSACSCIDSTKEAVYTLGMVNVSDELISDMKDAIVREVNPQKIVLFGSWALGQAHEHSDVDLLVIEREPFGQHRSRRLEAAKIWRCLSSFRVSKDILVYSSQELNQLPRVVRDALREGKVLYESG